MGVLPFIQIDKCKSGSLHDWVPGATGGKVVFRVKMFVCFAFRAVRYTHTYISSEGSLGVLSASYCVFVRASVWFFVVKGGDLEMIS